MASDSLVVLVVDGTEGFTYTIATTALAAISDSDFPDEAETCAWLDGYFVAFGPDDGFQISEDGTTWDPLDIASADVGGIVRGTADHGELVIFGPKKVVFWANTGAADFPFSPVISSAKEVGLAAKWSLTKFDDSLAFLGKNPLGQVQVYKLKGHTPVVISTPELDSLINRYANIADATAYAYMFEGHAFYRLNFPSAGKSWEYDGLTQLWHERQSGLDGGRHRGELSVDVNNKILIADYENGNIYKINATTYTENSVKYPMELTSRRVVKDYDPFSLSKLFLDFETGVGLSSGDGSDPQVMLAVSRDGGRTFSNEVWKDLGALGEYLRRVEYHQFGTAESFVFKVRITDPVKRHMVNASLIE